MKTDPRPYQFVFIGAATLTVAAEFNGLSVLAVTGGQVKRSTVALALNDVLATGDLLSITPTTTGGTVTLSCELGNQEFSGRFADLDGLTVDTTDDPPKLRYTRGDGTGFEIAFTASPLPQEVYTLGAWTFLRNDVPGGALWLVHLDLIPSTANTGMHIANGTITGLPSTANWVLWYDGYPQITVMPAYQFLKVPQGGDPRERSIDIYLTIPLGVTPADGLTLTFAFRP